MPHSVLPPFTLLVAACLVVPLLAFASQVDGLDLSLRESDLAPDVTLKEHENRTVQEYRINGRLYKVRITPSVGAPYYLVDQDGSGDLSWHSGSGPAVTQVPQWVLMRW
ncbi:MAG: DUF2782 domain-containing protein [Gammaproteobacteria bacterium]|jgi:hypothetical protein|nr:DUF2782 domain-containing protein [Candidatus Thioaporhodococcus sediminis]TNF51702.1 MAG: DUF2782 domain-containing protein [Gammaproteobacteria bacterium]